MSTTVKKWRIYCVTDDKYEESWSETQPTTCPTNTAHTIGSVTEVTTVDITGIVKIQEEKIPTGGNFQASTLSLTVPSNSNAITTSIWPFPISVLSIEWVSKDIHEGDKLDMTVGENSIVGFLGTAVTPRDEWVSQNYNPNNLVRYNKKNYKCILTTVSNEPPTNTTYWEYEPFTIPVSSTVVQNADIGFHINLFNGIQSDDLGRVISKDITNSTITLEYGTGNSYDIVQPLPTYIRMTVYMLKDYEMGPAWQNIVGESKIGGSYLPANTEVKVTYYNTSMTGSDKYIVGRVEYLY